MGGCRWNPGCQQGCFLHFGKPGFHRVNITSCCSRDQGQAARISPQSFNRKTAPEGKTQQKLSLDAVACSSQQYFPTMVLSNSNTWKARDSKVWPSYDPRAFKAWQKRDVYSQKLGKGIKPKHSAFSMLVSSVSHIVAPRWLQLHVLPNRNINTSLKILLK